MGPTVTFYSNSGNKNVNVLSGTDAGSTPGGVDLRCPPPTTSRIASGNTVSGQHRENNNISISDQRLSEGHLATRTLLPKFMVTKLDELVTTKKLKENLKRYLRFLDTWLDRQ